MSSEKVFDSDIKNPAALLEEFFSKHEYLSPEEKEAVSQAWTLLVTKAGDRVRECGKPYYLHPLRVANILAESKLDSPTLVAAILHTILDFNVTEEDLKNQFGENVCNIIVTVNKILNLPINTKQCISQTQFAICFLLCVMMPVLF
jgi:GTP pyrophosphokinase